MSAACSDFSSRTRASISRLPPTRRVSCRRRTPRPTSTPPSRRPPAFSPVCADSPLCQGSEEVQPPNRIIELQAHLLVRQRNRQNLSQTVPDPGRVVQAHVESLVDLAQLRQNAFQ